MRRRGWLYALPVVVFFLLAAGFYHGLQIDSNTLPSALIDQPAPRFAEFPDSGGTARHGALACRLGFQPDRTD